MLLVHGYHLSLDIDNNTGRCYSFYALLNVLRIIPANLTIPQSSRAKLYFVCDDKLTNISGCHYVPFKERCCWDYTNRILAVGDINEKGDLIEFATNTYAKLLEDFNFQVSLNEMSSIILNFDKTDYRCTSCEGYILPNKLIKRSIYIEQYKQGGLFLHINEREKLADFGIEYKMNNNSIYYDEGKNILAIGDIT